MPKQKDFQVIPGGKASQDPVGGPATLGVAQLLIRARHHRTWLSAQGSDETEALLRDYEDAIEALRRLQRSSEAGAQPRMAEYRRLIAELDDEILELLRRSPL